MTREERLIKSSIYIYDTDMWGEKLVKYTDLTDVISEIYDYFEPLEKMYNILKQQKEDLIEGQEILIKAHERTIEDYMSRTCESCKYLEVQSGVQPDGMYWQKINCTKGNVYDEWDYEIVSCLEWESKDDK
jgi:hypothetical protein